MRSPLWIGLSLLFLAGCRNCNCDLLEAELRTRENELRDLKIEMSRAGACNEAYQREIQNLHQLPSPKVTVEAASSVAAVKQINLGRQTGGYDNDDCPGDEALQVVVEPVDADGSVIKAPGKLYVEAIEITSEGIKIPLCFWEVPPDQLRRTWKTGLLSTGYYEVLPWKSWPSQTKIRVVARLTLADDRVFEAEKDVTIRLTALERRKPLPAAPVIEVAPNAPTPGLLPGPWIESKAPTTAPGSVAQGPASTRTSLYHAVQVFPAVPVR
jgi:hypothetical protein